jgi:hypothetical protein
MAHRDSHTANRRFTTAHVRFDRDTIDLHVPIFIRTSEELNQISITRFGPVCAEMHADIRRLKSPLIALPG